MLKVCLKTFAFIGKGHEILPELSMKIPSQIGQNYEILPELCKNALSYIEQFYKVIYIISPSNIGQDNKIISEL